MATLSTEQIDFIRSNLNKRSLSQSFLYNEWVDHVCCDVETLMKKGMDFNDAYDRVLRDKPELEVKDAHFNVQQFLNHKYVIIKKILYATFIVYAISWVINFGGLPNWVGLVSFLILGSVYLKISGDFFRKRRMKQSNILLSVFALLAAIGIITGIMLLFLNWNLGIDTRGHSVDLTIFGWFFISVLCLIFYIQEWRSSIDKKEVRKILLFAWVSGVNVFLAAVSIATFPLYRLVNEYIFILIGIILCVDIMVLTVMLITRSMKNTLAAAMVLGSFMIVFIHSPFRSKLPGGQPKMYEYTLQYTPQTTQDKQILYLFMVYKEFPGNPFTIPLRQQADKNYQVTIPSFAFKGYLYYGIEKDSSDAMQYFRNSEQFDSVYINIPKQKTYNLHND